MSTKYKKRDGLTSPFLGRFFLYVNQKMIARYGLAACPGLAERSQARELGKATMPDGSEADLFLEILTFKGRMV